MHRKGLSTIVTSVLVILIVLIAAGLIWIFARPLIVGGGAEFQSSTTCLSIQTAVLECLYTNNAALIKVKRGTDTTELTGIDFVLRGPNAFQAVVPWESRTLGLGLQETIPNSFETRTYIVQKPTSIETLVDVSVAPRIGEGARCTPNSEARTCTQNPSNWQCGDFDGSGGSPDGSDIDAFMTAFTAHDFRADLNGDLLFDEEDIVAFFGPWLAGETGPCPPDP